MTLSMNYACEYDCPRMGIFLIGQSKPSDICKVICVLKENQTT